MLQNDCERPVATVRARFDIFRFGRGWGLLDHWRTAQAIRVAARPSLHLSLHYTASTQKWFYTIAAGKQGANGDPMVGVLKPNGFVGHALNIALLASERSTPGANTQRDEPRWRNPSGGGGGS